MSKHRKPKTNHEPSVQTPGLMSLSDVLQNQFLWPAGTEAFWMANATTNRFVVMVHWGRHHVSTEVDRFAIVEAMTLCLDWRVSWPVADAMARLRSAMSREAGGSGLASIAVDRLEGMVPT